MQLIIDLRSKTLTLFLTFSLGASAAGSAPPWMDDVDEAIEGVRIENGPGGVVGIVVGGELVYEKAFGYAAP